MALITKEIDNAYRRWLSDPLRMEYLQLQAAEVEFMVPEAIYKKISFKRSRRYAVWYIEQQSKGCGDALIPYMAMTYYDRLRGKIEDETGKDKAEQENANYRKDNHLFLLCCIVIAWKMRTRNFNLKTFLKERNHVYSAREVLEMEYQICRRLRWRLRTLTPFCFVEYMIPILTMVPGTPSPRRHVRQLIAKTKFDPSFLEYRASILAAGAILTVSKKMYRGRHDVFEYQISTSEFVTPFLTMANKCLSHIEPLFNPPSSTPTAARRGDPKLRMSALAVEPEDPALQEEQYSSTRIIDDQPEDPAASEEQQEQEEEQLIHPHHRPGKEPVVTSNEIQPVVVRRRSRSIEVEPNDMLMDFELGWTEAQEEADRLGGISAILGSVVGEFLEDCCSFNLRSSHCNIM